MDLKFVVIKTLEKRDASGYDLMKIIYEFSGWKPSPGSMYPVLDSLLKEKLVTVRQKGKKKIYTLTNRGQTKAKEISKKSTKLIDNLINDLKLLNNFCKKDNSFEFIITIMENLKKGKMPFGKISKDMIELRNILIKLAATQSYKGNEQKIKKIIQNTTKQLKQI